MSHTVETRTFDIAISRVQACALAKAAPPCFGYYCQPSAEECNDACADPAVNRCSLPVPFLRATVADAASSGADPCVPSDTALILQCAVTELRGTRTNGCAVSAAGRRPSGSVDPSPADDTLATYLSECARLEAASVIAFEELAESLGGVGAPMLLVERCLAAAVEETRHARAVSADASWRRSSGARTERARRSSSPPISRASSILCSPRRSVPRSQTSVRLRSSSSELL